MIKKGIRNSLDNIQTCKFENILKRIQKYEYVSFDIFDTLVKRDVPQPADLFELIGYSLGIPDFMTLRINAEKKARELSPNAEVTLEDIYAQISICDENLKTQAKIKEIDLEYEVATPNQDIIPIYEYCKKEKKIIILSDMYLGRNIIEKILSKCGFEGYDEIYLSSENKRTKADGELYSCVGKKLKGKNVIHIGNSFKADYFSAKKARFHTIKISTYRNRKNQNSKNILALDSRKKAFLDTFINNHTKPAVSMEDVYYKFGFERFGPLLFGFVNWLLNEMKSDGIEQVLFMARDGFVIQKAYRLLGYSDTISDYYFEASRRSLRVPSYSEDMSFEEIIRQLTVPNMTNLVQIFDSLGLNINDYSNVVDSCGINREEHLKRDTLCDNEKFKALFYEIHSDIIANAKREDILLRKYLEQYDFRKKTALVDIGWGGSMQKFLVKTLRRMKQECDIVGYYIGLTEKSIENLQQDTNLSAKGYAFDRLNDSTSEDLERPFVGLFETLFLEQDGSVMRYRQTDDRIAAERYVYEYKSERGYSKEAAFVSIIQNGALEFLSEYNNSCIKKFVGYDSSVMFANLYQTGICPTLEDVRLFGDFEFFNNGNKVYLANPKSIFYYIVRPMQLVSDLYDSQWKIGFMKKLLKIKIPYLKLFRMLRKASN
ncbi:MAG: hypothetical protein LUG93_00410 [Lachnospiraceae bacterium]|nr:hypothetical protein [Lachnospiraceae bacterium]